MEDVKKLYRSISNGRLQDAESDLRDVLSRIVKDKTEAAKTVVSNDFNLDEPTPEEEIKNG